MTNIRILLNRRIPENYAFFCPETGLHLDVLNPCGFTTRLSNSILSGLRGGTLVEVDGVIDIDKGVIKNEKTVKEEVKKTVVEEKTQEPKKTSTKKASTKNTDKE